MDRAYGNMQLIKILSLILFVAGCGTTSKISVMPYDDSLVLPPTNPQTVKIFNDFPSREFDKIGEIQLSDWMWGQNDLLVGARGRQEDKLREEAAKMGGNAVVIRRDGAYGQNTTRQFSATSSEDSSGNVYTDGTVSGGGSYGRKIIGIVIRFKDGLVR